MTQLYLTQRRSKSYINHITHLLISADISIFSPEISKFGYVKKYRYRLGFVPLFLILLTFLESLIIGLINMVTNLMMSTKMSTPNLFKIKIFWNKSYNVITSAHDVTNNFLSRDSNYIVDLVIWPKFGNCSICMRKVIITSILEGLDQKNRFFDEWSGSGLINWDWH